MSGRPKDLIRSEAFIAVINYLEENDDEQITVNDLRTKMTEFADNLVDYNSYSFPYMKAELYKHFGDRIVMAELNGKLNVVTFRSTASQILYDYNQKWAVM